MMAAQAQLSLARKLEEQHFANVRLPQLNLIAPSLTNDFAHLLQAS